MPYFEANDTLYTVDEATARKLRRARATEQGDQGRVEVAPGGYITSDSEAIALSLIQDLLFPAAAEDGEL